MNIEHDLEDRRIRANEARQFMANPLWGQAWGAVEHYLHASALSCDPDNKDKAQRIVITQQLLAAVKREVERQAEDGEFVAVQLDELDRKRGLKRMFQR